MKKGINFWSWIVLLSLCIGFSSCSKDDDKKSFYIKAKINDKNYSAKVATGVMDGGLGEIVSISGFSFSNEPYNIVLSFPIDITVGTYDLSDNVWFGDYKAALWHNDYRYPSTDGSITITEYNTKKGLIKGTFQFTVEGYTITDGAFSAELP